MKYQYGTEIYDLSEGLSTAALKFYMTQEQVEAAHPANEQSGMRAHAAYEAAQAMVGERHANTHLVALVCALLQRT